MLTEIILHSKVGSIVGVGDISLVCGFYYQERPEVPLRLIEAVSGDIFKREADIGCSLRCQILFRELFVECFQGLVANRSVACADRA